jgi:ribosome-associated protein
VIAVNDRLSIPDDELHFAASRSGGPGGQNVNKVSSRVTLTFDVENSPTLTEDQRHRIASKLSARISKDGVLRVVSQRTRSQDLNKADALSKFCELLRDALFVERPGFKTKTPRVAKEKRLDEKRRRTAVKETRRSKNWD